MRGSPGALRVTCCVALVAAACGGGGEGSPAPRRWVVANVHPASHPTAQALTGLADAVAADPQLAGVSLDLQLDGVLGNEKEVLEKVGFGAVQLYAGSVAPLAEFAPELGVLTLPYLFRDSDHFWQVLDGAIGDQLLADLRPAGFVGLAWYDAGARSFYDRRRPIRQLSDLAGLKIRVQKSAVMQETVAALGAVPVAMGYKEVYTGLYTGAIDGAENNLPSYRSERHFEVARHYALDRHAMVPDLLLISATTWQRLGPQQQQALRRLARDSSQQQRRLWRQQEQVAAHEVQQAGCTITEVSDPQAFRAAVAPVYAGRPEWTGLVGRIRAVGRRPAASGASAPPVGSDSVGASVTP